jgi:hypothetical protein
VKVSMWMFVHLGLPSKQFAELGPNKMKISKINVRCSTHTHTHTHTHSYVLPFEIITMMVRIVLFSLIWMSRNSNSKSIYFNFMFSFKFKIFDNDIFKFNFHSKIHLYEKVILKQNDMESLSKIMLLPYFISFGPNLN